LTLLHAFDFVSTRYDTYCCYGLFDNLPIFVEHSPPHPDLLTYTRQLLFHFPIVVDRRWHLASIVDRLIPIVTFLLLLLLLVVTTLMLFIVVPFCLFCLLLSHICCCYCCLVVYIVPHVGVLGDGVAIVLITIVVVILIPH